VDVVGSAEVDKRKILHLRLLESYSEDVATVDEKTILVLS
jgi:hypothetical protein